MFIRHLYKLQNIISTFRIHQISPISMYNTNIFLSLSLFLFLITSNLSLPNTWMAYSRSICPLAIYLPSMAIMCGSLRDHWHRMNGHNWLRNEMHRFDRRRHVTHDRFFHVMRRHDRRFHVMHLRDFGVRHVVVMVLVFIACFDSWTQQADGQKDNGEREMNERHLWNRRGTKTEITDFWLWSTSFGCSFSAVARKVVAICGEHCPAFIGVYWASPSLWVGTFWASL